MITDRFGFDEQFVGDEFVEHGSMADLRAHLGLDAAAIQAAIEKCLHDEEWRETCRNTSNPYYLGGAGEKIADVLSKVDLSSDLLRKKMTISGLPE